MSVQHVVEDPVRALHAPVWRDSMGSLYCEGDDFGGYEGEDPEWPCRTAALVYTEAEIAEYKEAQELFERWYYPMTDRNPRPRRKNWASSIWEIPIGQFIADKVFPMVPIHRNQITFRYEKEFNVPPQPL